MGVLIWEMVSKYYCYPDKPGIINKPLFTCSYPIAAGAADRIPREWEQKLDALNLQDLMGHSVRMAKREYDMSLRWVVISL